MIKKYQDKKWLEKKYISEKLSQRQIGKLCKTSNVVILYWMKKFNIFARSNHSSQANHCSLNSEAIEWLNGELLGDGCLRSESFYSARFDYVSKHLEYIIYVSKTLKSFGIEQSGKIRKKINKKWKNISYSYVSLSYEELLPIYKQWYPNAKKIVPKNIKITPTTLRQWYIGDGSLVKRKVSKNQIILATYGFLVSDVEWLVKELMNLGFKTTRRNCNTIHISIYSVKNFLNFIGKCPVSCYQYKFNY